MVAAKRLDALQARLAEIEGDDWDDADTVVSDGGGPLFTPHEEDSDDGDDGQGDGADPDLDLTTLPRARDKKRGLKQVGRAPRPSVKKETAAVLNIPAAPVSLVGTLEAAKPEAEFDKRYEPGEMLGEGGMGEVRLYRDKRVGREVAIKSLHAEARDSAKYRERFLFEARVQGQLEHPGVVPVYDIGKLPDGTEFLSMKRLSGQTLREVINALRKKDRATAFTFTRRRLLAAFQSLCLVVDYAHQKGVIHRDIKPTNIMLGHYGEVQLLDWGVAKLNEAGSSAKLGFEVEHEATEVGEVMGTPGYMSPEQATGTSKVDARSDIFSLGAILFEILTYERLVPYQEGDVTQLTLLGGYDAHISQRFPGSDVPTELEQLCVAATEHNPDERTMTAREIHDAIEQHLEGEGDAKRRQSMSRKHTRAAISALSQIAEGGGMAHAPQAADLRASAIQNVMRALALDPDNQVAMQTMVRLMTDLPEVSELRRPGSHRARRADHCQANFPTGRTCFRALRDQRCGSCDPRRHECIVLRAAAAPLGRSRPAFDVRGGSSPAPSRPRLPNRLPVDHRVCPHQHDVRSVHVRADLDRSQRHLGRELPRPTHPIVRHGARRGRRAGSHRAQFPGRGRSGDVLGRLDDFVLAFDRAAGAAHDHLLGPGLDRSGGPPWCIGRGREGCSPRSRTPSHPPGLSIGRISPPRSSRSKHPASLDFSLGPLYFR